jgi:hypothetical protein
MSTVRAAVYHHFERATLNRNPPIGERPTPDLADHPDYGRAARKAGSCLPTLLWEGITILRGGDGVSQVDVKTDGRRNRP